MIRYAPILCPAAKVILPVRRSPALLRLLLERGDFVGCEAGVLRDAMEGGSHGVLDLNGFTTVTFPYRSPSVMSSE